MKGTFKFGKFCLDAVERTLLCGGEFIRLTPKQFDLLSYFVRNPGRTTKKIDLLDAVWADTFVEETTLARNVSWLREKLAEGADGETLIQTVPKVGYRFTADVSISDETTLIVEEQIVHHVRAQETITISDTIETTAGTTWWSRLLTTPRLIITTVLLVAFSGCGYALYSAYFGSGSGGETPAVRNPAAVPARLSDSAPIKVGSIVNLQNRFPSIGGYLDAWGAVWRNPQFIQVPTEVMFVSTHMSPDRDNGSGSWEITSARGKNKGEPLVFGDQIHLRNMHPKAGYLDTCGWIEHLVVFREFSDQTAAIFTTPSPDRDNGSGTWTIWSATEQEGSPVLEGDSIALESNLNIDDRGRVHIAGFLNVAGSVKDIPSLSDHDGLRLVFSKYHPGDQPVPDIWTITTSKAVLREK